jgi:serine/threonine protein kinase
LDKPALTGLRRDFGSTEKATPKRTLVNVLGVVYVHTKTSDGGDLYLTRFAESCQEHFAVENWYERDWFNTHKTRLIGTSSVYKVPTKEINGKSLDLVVKNCRVGEDVPIDTHILQEFCDTEFNSPWEEFSLVMELMDNVYGPKEMKVNTQLPMAIYVPPETMQVWQSGRSRIRINRIKAKHPGIHLDILKQYKLIYEWIRGHNLTEVFEHIDINHDELVSHLTRINYKALGDLNRKGYLMADIKPEHIIMSEADTDGIVKTGRSQERNAPDKQIDAVYQLIHEGRYSIIDYELLLRTPEHDEAVKSSRRHSYLDDQRHRFDPTPLPAHLSHMEIFGVPYLYGHAESTGGRLWVVGRNAHLFDYFLPERWRKTPSLKLSSTKEVFYTITKDNIHLVWETSRVGEMPVGDEEGSRDPKVRQYGINSPFEEFAIAHTLNQLGIPAVYVRAIYMTGTAKVEASTDLRKYESHKNILDPEGNPVLQENHNYITIRGYFNGPDQWVAEHEGELYSPMDLSRALDHRMITEEQCQEFLDTVKEQLQQNGFDGSSLRANDLLLAVDDKKEFMRNNSGEPMVLICNFELIWKISG